MRESHAPRRKWVIASISVVLLGGMLYANLAFPSEPPINASVIVFVDAQGRSRFTAHVATPSGDSVNLHCTVRAYFTFVGSPNTQGDVSGTSGFEVEVVNGSVSHSGRLWSKIDGRPVAFAESPPEISCVRTS